MVNMNSSSPQKKVLAAAQAGEVFLNVQSVCRGGGGEGADDGAGFGTLDGVGKQPIFSSDDKGTDGILGAIVIHRDIAVFQAAVKILLFIEAVLHRLGLADPFSFTLPYHVKSYQLPLFHLTLPLG